MKETVKPPPAATRQPKHSGAGEQFFSPGRESAFFKATPVRTRLKVGKRGDIYEQQAEAMADQVVSRAAVTGDREEQLHRQEQSTIEPVRALRRKPFFESESDGEPVQRLNREVEEGEKVYRNENDLPTGMSKGEAIVAIARSKLGKVKAKQPAGSDGGRQLRDGSALLLEIFQLAAPGVWSEDVIKYLGPGLPSWCGIFATYCIKKAGINIGNWQMGKGVTSYSTIKPTDTPQPGDIGYIDQPYQHHCIVAKVDGDIIESIDGNSGLYSEIIENKRPRKAYTGFFTALHNAATVQKKEREDNSSERTEDLESRLQAGKGQGQPLDDKTRGSMEGSFGSDFSGVRIHTGGEATQLSNDLNAKAFTHGNDIYFNEGSYNPETSSGKHLLAHELTHTVQQREGLRRMVQRAKEKNTADVAAEGTVEGNVFSHPKLGSIDTGNSVITIKEIKVPGFKKEFGPSGAFSLLKKGDSERPTDQIAVWEKEALKGTAFETKFHEKIKKEKSLPVSIKSQPVYYLRLKGSSGDSGMIFGTLAAIKTRAARPNWTDQGKYTLHDVDHKQEYQLGGTHAIANMWLLEASANRSSGSRINNDINSKISALLAPARTTFGSKIPDDPSKAKKTFNITVTKGVAASDSTKKNAIPHWELGQIQEGEQLKGLKALTKDQIKSQNLAGSPDKLVVYLTPTGGKRIQVPWKKESVASKVKSGKIARNLDIQEVHFDKNEGGKKVAKVIAFKNDSKLKTEPFDLQIEDNLGVEWGGTLKRDRTAIAKAIENIKVPPLSPIKFTGVDLTEDGLVAEGKLLPTIPVFEKADINVALDDSGANLNKTFYSDELALPSPFKIQNSNLFVSVGTGGVRLKGDINFEIKKLGSGTISAYLSGVDGVSLKGRFDFDKKLFKGNKASIDVTYDKINGWAIQGDLEIGKGSVKGINSAKISVAYAKDTLAASGTAEVALKGVKEVTLGIKFGDETSEIEGGVKIEKLPGIKEGEGKLKVVKKGDIYDFSGSGKITPDIPGLSTQVDFEFHNDIFLVDARVAYDKGRLKGTLNVGITNRAIDPEGKPTGEALPDYKVYGKSSLELKITDKLVVTAGVNLLENGEIEVKGGIKLPQKFEVVPKLLSVIDKPLITIPPIHIPLFGIPLGVTTIGIEAVITPMLTANVQIGPGSLVNVGAEVVYNPAHPDEMTVTGAADFEFIAEAGITAGVDFDLAASIAIASLSGGINLSAYIKAAAKQPVFHTEVKYSPKTGFELSGLVDAKVAAILGFSGDLKVKASAGIWPLKISKTWKWPLFKKEVDTGLQIGFEFPFAYKDGKADVSFNNLKFTYPSLSDLTTKVREKIVDPIVDDF